MAQDDEPDLDPDAEYAASFSKLHGLTPPVDIEEILREFADIEEDNIPHGCDGLLIRRTGRRPLVLVSRGQIEVRRRFTLAHELGHFKLNHVIKRVGVMFVMSLGFLALLGWLKNQAWFYLGLGVTPLMDGSNDAMALILFMFALPVFTFLLSPLLSITSRKNEFEADAFAAKHSNSQDLISALVKLYEDNASTLTPDPLHSAFYDSHPPASVRIQRLLSV